MTHAAMQRRPRCVGRLEDASGKPVIFVPTREDKTPVLESVYALVETPTGDPTPDSSSFNWSFEESLS
jgi:hypothetical protein